MSVSRSDIIKSENCFPEFGMGDGILKMLNKLGGLSDSNLE